LFPVEIVFSFFVFNIQVERRRKTVAQLSIKSEITKMQNNPHMPYL
jgi:hypothetical protein